MRDSEIRQVQSLARVDDFGTEHAADFPGASLGGKKFAAVKALVLTLDKLGEDQSSADGAARQSAEAKRQARNTMLEIMGAMRDTSKAMEADMPGVSNQFRIPTNNGDEALVNAARAFVTAGTPLKEEFTQREMPATFLEDLSAAIATFESAGSSRNLQVGKRVAATAGVKSALASARQLKKELDPIIRNKYRDDAATLAAWKSARHVERPAKPPKNDNAPPPPPTE